MTTGVKDDLVLACRACDLAAVDALIAAGRDVNAADAATGDTPLMAAAESGHSSCLRRLLEAGARPDVQTRSGNTAMRTAVLLGDSDAVEALLAAGADASLETSRGTPLTAAAAAAQSTARRALNPETPRERCRRACSAEGPRRTSSSGATRRPPSRTPWT